MRTISVTIDEDLLARIDGAATGAGRTRSETFRIALEDWLTTRRFRQWAAEERAAYSVNPVAEDEFDGLISAQTMDSPGNDSDEGQGW